VFSCSVSVTTYERATTVKLLIASVIISAASLFGASPASAEPACYEDMACWNPATMGNHQGSLPDGQVPVPGDYSIVS
jgi:hypothetical protein